MIKAEVQHGQVQNQPTMRQGRGAAVESPGSAQIAQLEAMIDASPQMSAQRELAAQINTSPAMAAQRKFVEGLGGSPRMATRTQAPAQLQSPSPKPNHTGLPDNLKSGIENLSGMSMDHVKVHYNSSQPAQLNALAYAQGADIHVAPGQEQHLPHEAWHVVQQAQGRVQPTMQMKDGVPVNDDRGLEHEADAMGAKALQRRQVDRPSRSSAPQAPTTMALESVQLEAAEISGSNVGATGKNLSLNFLSGNRNSSAQALQARWRNDSATMNSEADLHGMAGVAIGTISAGSDAEVSLTSGDDYWVAPNAALALEAGSPAVRAMRDGKHTVGETTHGAADWANATAPWPYITKMRERFKTYEKPGEASITAADQNWETAVRGGSADLALEGHNEYAISALSIVQQFLKGYDQIYGKGPSAAREKADWFKMLHERSVEAYVVLQRLRAIGIDLADKQGRTPKEEQYLQMAIRIDISEGYKQIAKIASDNATGYVTKLGGWAERNILKNIYDIQDLVNLVVPRIIAIDNFQNMQSLNTLNAGRHRDRADWDPRAAQVVTGPATRNIRELEMVRRINGAPSPLLVQVGRAHIPGLRALGAAGTLHDDEFAFEMATQKTTINFGGGVGVGVGGAQVPAMASAMAGGGQHAQIDVATANRHLQTLERLSNRAAAFMFTASGGSLKAQVEAQWVGIRQMYKAASLLHHPDKGGQEADFKALIEAYKALEAIKDGGGASAALGGSARSLA